MRPKNTQLGASASTRRAPSPRAGRGVPSPVTPVKTAVPRAARGRADADVPVKNRPRKAEAARRDGSGYRWWLLPIVVMGVIALFIGAYYPVARVEYRETRERAALQAELGAIQTRNARLRSEVARLKTPEGVEDYARLKLGMVKRGEHVVIVSDGTEPTETSVANALPEIDSQEAVKPPVGPWTAFLDAFFGVQ
jgi:hypothetical protein